MPDNNVSSFRRRDYFKITVFGFALTALSQSLHSIILPQRILDFVPEAQKNTCLGLMTLTGLLLAVFAQPVAGAFSDRSTYKWGRRRPYILIGGILMLLIIPGIGYASSFAFIFVVYCLMQLAGNTAQGPFQALIPDLVPANKRGLASGIKALLEVVGGAILVLISSIFIDRYAAGEGSRWLWLVLGILDATLLGTMIITLLTVKETPVTAGYRQTSVWAALLKTAREFFSHCDLVWFLVSRLLVYMAFTTIQQFALYYLRDVIGVADPAGATARFLVIAVVGMLIAVWPAGYLSDKVGRKPISFAAALLGAAGIGIIALSQEYNTVLWAAGIIGMAMGAFNSANWALATDLVAKGEEARYLGIANMATAGGAALARGIGPAIDFFNRRGHLLGYSVMLWCCIAYFIVGALLVFKVKRQA
jgi:Na+/melibiose symporter-like transporter